MNPQLYTSLSRRKFPNKSLMSSTFGSFDQTANQSPPSISDIWYSEKFGALKRPQNLVQGVYVDWFESYSDFKIPLY